MPAHSPAPLQLPATMPVMVLADCHLLPGCLLPLFIFEERYRQMLAHALRTDRMFCVGSRVSAEGEKVEIFPYTTAGLVSMCKTQPDGTSHVILQGLQRVRLTGCAQEKPFIIANIEPVISKAEQPEVIRSLKDRALKLLPELDGKPGEAVRELKLRLQGMQCCESACDILAYHFLRRGSSMRRLMAEPAVEKRWQILIAELEKVGESL